jgi:hypothetical protein
MLHVNTNAQAEQAVLQLLPNTKTAPATPGNNLHSAAGNTVPCCTSTQQHSARQHHLALCSNPTSHPASPQCRAHGAHIARSPAPSMADSNTGNHCNLQHKQCSTPHRWPAKYQHNPSAVHKVLCTQRCCHTAATCTCSHNTTPSVLCCCLEHWNNLPPHTHAAPGHLQRSCPAAAHPHQRGSAATGKLHQQ